MNIFTFGSEKIIKDKSSLFKIQPLLKFNKNISNISDNVTSFYKNNIISKEKKFIFHLPIKINNNPISIMGQVPKFNNIYYYKIDIGFCNSIRLMFCCCKSQTKINYKEYLFVFKELLKYIDYIEVSKFFMDVEKIKSILKSNNISDEWISQNKLVGLNVSNNDLKDVSKMVNSTVLLNNNMFFAGDNKTSDLLDILKNNVIK